MERRSPVGSTRPGQVHLLRGGHLPPFGLVGRPAGGDEPGPHLPRPRRAMGGWTHWLVADFPVGPDQIPTIDPLPSGAKGVANHFGYSHYGGPCPPSGSRRYFFVLYALKGETPTEFGQNNFQAKTSAAALDSAGVMGTYFREIAKFR